MAQLRRDVASIHRYGAELVVIGNGTEEFARAFREALQLDTPLYVDPTCASYRALGMKRGLGRTLAWRTWMKMGRAILQNIVQGRAGTVLRWWRKSIPALVPGASGDAWQLGGVLIVLPDGRIPYRYLSGVAGDHPPISDLLAALAATTLEVT